MNKKLLIALFLIAACLIGMMAGLASNRGSGAFIDNSSKTGELKFTAENAAKGTGGVGYLTLKEGQNLGVRSQLTKDSRVTIKVYPAEAGAMPDFNSDVEPALTVQVKGIDSSRYELPAGDYILLITVTRKADGSMLIRAD
ncbi:MAG: hypothetical protein IJH45_05270 [Firmicutes bacterium]|nr:hypothetical protein [Bacillota bacterium]MBQ7278922.1 hypothetical protein [Clostridia bacterium]MBR0375661.1 hypothetical protein [Bacillota bacterium]